MYRYNIKGEDFEIGKVKKIGKAIAVIVNKEWLGSKVVVIKEGNIKQYVDEEWDSSEEGEKWQRKKKL